MKTELRDPKQLYMLGDEMNHFYASNDDVYAQMPSSFVKPEYYLRQFRTRVNFLNWRDVTFAYNASEPIHRWSPYVEGFSSSLVRRLINELSIDTKHLLLDPFSGCGTLNITAKLANINSVGVEMNPLMFFVLKTKLNWDIDLGDFINVRKSFFLESDVKLQPPSFLLNDRQFRKPVLDNLLRINQAIQKIDNSDIAALFKVAFASIIMDCSNLKRSPSIGYASRKYVTDDTPIQLFTKKLDWIQEDLEFVQQKKVIASSLCYNADSKTVDLEPSSIDFIITSPPYFNSMDYVGNYKLEIGWLGYAHSTIDLRQLRDSMVVCDNVSRPCIRNYSERGIQYEDSWLDHIQQLMEERTLRGPKLRRQDYPLVLRKYFDDLFAIMGNCRKALKPRGHSLIVIGDSFLNGVYIPTDLLLARIGEKLGFTVRSIDILRNRRSGVIQAFKLRESVVHLQLC
jgi:DNA modification methylase